MSTTWILVANASEAHLFQSPTSKLFNGAVQLERLQDYYHPASRSKNSDLVSGEAGRSFSTQFGSHTFTESGDDPHQRQLDEFAKEIVEQLDAAHKDRVFDELVVAAPAQFRGALRRYSTKRLSRAVRMAIDKDYTKLTPKKLAAQIQAYM